MAAVLLLCLIAPHSLSAEGLLGEWLGPGRLSVSVGLDGAIAGPEDDISQAFTESEFYGSFPGIFGTVHYPTVSSGEFSWGLEASWRHNDQWSVALGRYRHPRQEVTGPGISAAYVSDFEHENCEGTTLYLALDYYPKSWAYPEWEPWGFSIGGGLSRSSFSIDGDFGHDRPSFTYDANKLGLMLRTTVDRTVVDHIAVQLRLSGHVIPSIGVPEQTDGGVKTLRPHSINLSAFVISIRAVARL